MKTKELLTLDGYNMELRAVKIVYIKIDKYTDKCVPIHLGWEIQQRITDLYEPPLAKYNNPTYDFWEKIPEISITEDENEVRHNITEDEYKDYLRELNK